MLIEKERWAGIRDGSVTVLFRRWRHRQASAGGTYRTGAGRIVVESMAEVDPQRVRLADVRAAGYRSVAHMVADLRGEEGAPVYMLRIRVAEGPDPREELSHADQLSAEDVAAISGKLERMDRSGADGPWTLATLRIIEQMPATRAPDLAERLGREPDRFKIDVRKLKNLGLTHSLGVGYRLSPRGIAYLRARENA
ncbi:hypothetical protein IU433_30760 [Nocardia puris]|uniref:ASCH domain-containing protein n=1 Tax=Nocardia puris TaxID=208602 RepID=A0A366CZ64_9NOCA|nr:hypothetical protein [Nocardia puris]MBF6215215.1 hypothetical protein [Nocardia puris]MBF6369735.1 hypothetical protein [Nocardia puris]MBF6463385.1 hypothetical protein [Nocardia puris]RBO82955.1 hypothetical protein DFR74_12145 [Nocardia puris]